MSVSHIRVFAIIVFAIICIISPPYATLFIIPPIAYL